MKLVQLLFLCLITLSAYSSLAQPAQTTSATATYTNPLPVQLGDPYMLHTQGMYYMYGTDGGAKKGFVTYSSSDMVHWKPEGQVYVHDNKNGWSDPKSHVWRCHTGHPKSMKYGVSFTCFTVPNGT